MGPILFSCETTDALIEKSEIATPLGQIELTPATHAGYPLGDKGLLIIHHNDVYNPKIRQDIENIAQYLKIHNIFLGRLRFIYDTTETENTTNFESAAEELSKFSYELLRLYVKP